MNSVNLQVTSQQYNTIMTALLERPAKEVMDVINVLHSQQLEQVEQDEAPTK